jgi:hypothetical protein
MGAGAFGHTGYTGTSLWLDPERDMFVLLLTNRVHAARALRPAKVIGDVRADLADAAELAVLDDPVGVRAMPATFRADEASGWNTRPARTVTRGKARSTSSKASRAKSTRSKSAKSAKGGKSASARASSAKKSSAKSSSAKKASGKGSAKKSTTNAKRGRR